MKKIRIRRNRPDDDLSGEQIVFWTFWQRHRPDVKAWHFAANDPGLTALRSAIATIAPERNAVKAFPLSEVLDAVKVAGNKRRAMLAKRLTLRFMADSPERFEITENDGDVNFEFGEVYRKLLIERLDDLLNNRGAPDIGSDVLRLNFWWWTL